MLPLLSKTRSNAVDNDDSEIVPFIYPNLPFPAIVSKDPLLEYMDKSPDNVFI